MGGGIHMRILLADDKSLRTSNISHILENLEIIFDFVETFEDLEEMSKWPVFDLIIMTDNIPTLDLLKFIRKYRAEKGAALILTVLKIGTTLTIVDVLDNGADDCIRLPCNEDEVGARVRSLVRRDKPEKSRDIILGPLKWETVTNTFWLEEKLLDITRMEKLVLRVLMRNPEKILAKEYIAEQVYNFDNNADTKTLAFHIHGIRKKLSHCNNISIDTIKNQGYRLKAKV